MLQTWETFAVLLQPSVREAQTDEAEKWTVWESAVHGGALRKKVQKQLGSVLAILYLSDPLVAFSH